LAVMKSGAAYVVLDVRQAPDRLRSMVLDAGLEVVLLDSRHSVLPVGGVDAVYLDDAVADGDWLSEYPQSLPDVSIDGGDSVYVLYTSGSTGLPKGVEIHHAGLTDYCAYARESYWSQALAGSLVVTSAAFDLTVPSLYVPLLCGGCVELLPELEELEELSRRLDERSRPGQLLRMTPSHVQALLVLSDAHPREAAHVFVVGGERFGVELARSLQAKYPSSRIVNHYGPTETVVGCASYEVSGQLSERDRTIPIGRPMSNTRLYVLGAGGELQPVGVAGELYIGGSGVAKGYVNQPEQTAAKFVADAYEAGARVYRSGDRVRWRADGNLEFLGRVDDQVKLRGFRIELGEIESVLRAQAGVREAVLGVREVATGEQLVAWVVTDGGEVIDRVRAGLSGQLPGYMQPSAWVRVDALPLTVNGKVDRSRLPEPELRVVAFEPPTSVTEHVLAGVWREVLGVAEISVTADFFELGGHSLLATRVINAVQHRLNVELPIRLLFECPNIRGIAALIDAEDIRRRNRESAAQSGAHVEMEW